MKTVFTFLAGAFFAAFALSPWTRDQNLTSETYLTPSQSGQGGQGGSIGLVIGAGSTGIAGRGGDGGTAIIRGTGTAIGGRGGNGGNACDCGPCVMTRRSDGRAVCERERVGYPIEYKFK